MNLYATSKKKYSCAQKFHISFVSLQNDFKSVANE